MQVHIQLAAVILSLVAGAISILIANRLMRRYRTGYLSSYFYFLVFSYIFGVYSIIGSQAIHFFLSRQDIEARTILSATRFLVALGVPFLILSWYMFFRVARELFNKELNWVFGVAFFAIHLLLFSLFILLGLNLVEALEFQFMKNAWLMPVAFSAATLLNLGLALLWILSRMKKLNDLHQRKAVKWFVIWYAVYIALVISAVSLAMEWRWIGLFFISILLGFHLLPVLYLNNYLNLHFVAGVEASDFSGKLSAFTEKYGISKRESEIVSLICKGMTNQQISDSLFISLQTVKDHVHRIFLKTGVKNRVQLSNLLEE